MEKHIGRVILSLIVVATLFSCKKNSSKDYSQSIKDKTWSGELTYTGKTPEYYSVQFNADNSLTWSQQKGDYAGHWVLDGKTLTITFTVNTVEIKADITDDDKLVNITDNTTVSEINSGQLITNSKISLDNTIWKGSIDQGANPAVSMQLSFIPGSKLEFKVSANPVEMYNYTRASSGAAISFFSNSGQLYGTMTSGSEMKGIYYNASPPLYIQYKWRATKQ